ncbi:MAG: DUF368 domain-containing protein [Patescibacteria group bacterium]|nr:DUF368 domain-containing protein [Patescibacteria group bacterium]
MSKYKEKINIFLKGFAMGAVDIIPGISGGTMALILGIYEKIILELKKINFKNLKNLLSKKQESKEKIDLNFLIWLFLGIITAIVSLAKLIHYLLQNYPNQLYGFFLGLILASIFLLLPKNFYKNKNYFFLIPGFIIAWLISSSGSLNSSNTYFNIFLSGFLAICAMILPGISGSFILLILGKYEFMISVLKNPFINNNLFYILIFAFGCLLGLLSFVKLLGFLFKKHKEQSLAVLIGFMAGALKKIWPFQELINEKNLFINITPILLLIILGITAGVLIPKMAKTKNRG